jgi:hypothetical protein
VIEAILPAGAVAEEAFSDPPGVPLFPEEEAVIAKAVAKRRREFTRHGSRRRSGGSDSRTLAGRRRSE